MQPINERDKSIGTQISFNPWLICAVCFCVMAVDGFDTAAIAYVAPSLTQLWHLPQAAMTPAFVATSAGAVVGYVASGAIARTIPRRTMKHALFTSKYVRFLSKFAAPKSASIHDISTTALKGKRIGVQRG
jgi:predicted MFS family arabinose efflux permease